MGVTNLAVRDPGEPPDLDWIDPGLIDVDPTYQRDLDEARVQRILEWFSWSSFGALTVVSKDGGRFNATDGQHRLEAAKRHPAVELVPCVIPKISGTVAEATNFVSLNAERKNVTPLQLYWAQLAAEDGEAVTVASVCERAGITIVRSPGGQTKMPVNATTAIGAIRGLIDKHGAMKARMMLDILSAAQLEPIIGVQVRAVEILRTEAEFEDADSEALTEAIGGHAEELELEAKAFAVTHRLTLAKAFASCWYRRSRKRRKATQ